jgi:hypothetical protein
MNRTTIGIIVLGFLFLTTACVPQNRDSIPQNEPIQAGEREGDEIQLQYEGIGPLEITPHPGGRESAEIPPSDEMEGYISSAGEKSFSDSQSNEPGFVDSVSPNSLGLAQEEGITVEWLTYTDQAYSFSIDYPNIYMILPESAGSIQGDPLKVHQVRFQDIQLATGETAEFEIPIFKIEIFELGDQSLEDFIAQTDPDGLVEEYQVNNLQGFRVSYKQLIAPNEFYYFSSQGYAYKLTPLGPFGPEMVQSFNIQ